MEEVVLVCQLPFPANVPGAEVGIDLRDDVFGKIEVAGDRKVATRRHG